MSRSSDIAALTKGLQKIIRAASNHQQSELLRNWTNSSLRTAVKGANDKFEESVSDVPTAGDLISSANAAVESLQERSISAIDSIKNVELPKFRQLTEDSENNDEEFAAANAWLENDRKNNKITQTKKWNLDKIEFSEDNFILQKSFNTDINNTPKPTVSSIPPDYKLHRSNVTHSNNKDINVEGRKSFHYDSSSEAITAEDLKKKEKDETMESVPKRSDKVEHKPVHQTSKRNIKPLSKYVSSHLNEKSKESRVPGTRIGRMVSFGSLAAGLGVGTIAEITRRSLGFTDSKDMAGSAVLDNNPLLSSANVERIVNTLCRVRGAALKLGQMLSIQDNSLINPELQAIFERVRQSADFMPAWQMEKVLVEELGTDWRSKILSFEEKPFAAASIGQVHKATLLDGRDVAMKIQYPGVASSINSDIDNLMGIMKVWKILPDGLYVDKAMDVARRELSWECDYIREAECSQRFRENLKHEDVFYVPEVIQDLTSKQVLTTELVSGESIDKFFTADQETKNFIGKNILRLCLKELFSYNFMQTDPNWSNFLYDEETEKIILLDFGASREFSRDFTDYYIKVIKSAAVNDRQRVLDYSVKLGFLTGFESKMMQNAHVDAVMILGEAFAKNEPFDFGRQTTARRIHELIPVMLKHRLSPPPEETYSLHRKMAGCFLICSKLNANINCKPLFDNIYETYQFQE